MSKYQRNKGASYERTLATAFRAAGYTGARRGLGQARSAKEVSDIEGTPWWIEAKVGARPNILAAVEQARRATDGRPVLVCTRRDRESTLVTMEFAEFMKTVLNLPKLSKNANISKPSSPIPRPGTKAALAVGCTCPVMDNEYGAGWMGMGDVFYYAEGCPIHLCPKTTPDRMDIGE